MWTRAIKLCHVLFMLFITVIVQVSIYSWDMVCDHRKVIHPGHIEVKVVVVVIVVII